MLHLIELLTTQRVVHEHGIYKLAFNCQTLHTSNIVAYLKLPGIELGTFCMSRVPMMFTRFSLFLHDQKLWLFPNINVTEYLLRVLNLQGVNGRN